MDRRDLRDATLLIVSIGAVGCAKLNAAYAPEGEGATSGLSGDVTTESMVDGVTSDASAGSGRPGGTSDGTTDPGPGPVTDASDTHADTGTAEGPAESSGDEGSSSGDVFGTLPELGAELIVDDGQMAPTCEPSFGGLAVESPTLVEVIVRTNAGPADILAVRDATDLCELSEDCCEPTDDGAANACSDAGLWGCVTLHDPFCSQTWDLICVQTAVLFCGADCEQAIQTGR